MTYITYMNKNIFSFTKKILDIEYQLRSDEKRETIFLILGAKILSLV